MTAAVPSVEAGVVTTSEVEAKPVLVLWLVKLSEVSSLCFRNEWEDEVRAGHPSPSQRLGILISSLDCTQDDGLRLMLHLAVVFVYWKPTRWVSRDPPVQCNSLCQCPLLHRVLLLLSPLSLCQESPSVDSSSSLRDWMFPYSFIQLNLFLLWPPWFLLTDFFFFRPYMPFYSGCGVGLEHSLLNPLYTCVSLSLVLQFTCLKLGFTLG